MVRNLNIVLGDNPGAVGLRHDGAEGCSAQGRALIQAAIETEALNRVVVAGCYAQTQPEALAAVLDYEPGSGGYVLEAFEPGGLREYVGGYDDWLRQRDAVAATAAPPAMSIFMSSMDPVGFRLSPPVSKHTPLPTSVSRGPVLPQARSISRGARGDARPTACTIGKFAARSVSPRVTAI
mgnify:CR=1 FL=1